MPPRAPSTQGRSSAACPPRASPRETPPLGRQQRPRDPVPPGRRRNQPPSREGRLHDPQLVRSLHCRRRAATTADRTSISTPDLRPTIRSHLSPSSETSQAALGGGLPAVGVSTANTNALRSRVAQSSLARRAPAICEDVHPGEGRATALPAPCRGSDWRRRRSRRLRWGRAQLVSSNTLLWPDGENLCGHPDLQRVNLRSKAIRGCPQRIVRKMRIAAGGHRAGVT